MIKKSWLLLFLLAIRFVAAEPPRPNVVFLLADDLRPDCLGVLGHPIVKTPNIDKLLENGFIFRNACKGARPGCAPFACPEVRSTGPRTPRASPTPVRESP